MTQWCRSDRLPAGPAAALIPDYGRSGPLVVGKGKRVLGMGLQVRVVPATDPARGGAIGPSFTEPESPAVTAGGITGSDRPE